MAMMMKTVARANFSSGIAGSLTPCFRLKKNGNYKLLLLFFLKRPANANVKRKDRPTLSKRTSVFNFSSILAYF